MHESVANDISRKEDNDPKLTLELVANASLVEEESHSRQVATATTLEAAVDGHGTAEPAAPVAAQDMQLDSADDDDNDVGDAVVVPVVAKEADRDVVVEQVQAAVGGGGDEHGIANESSNNSSSSGAGVDTSETAASSCELEAVAVGDEAKEEAVAVEHNKEENADIVVDEKGPQGEIATADLAENTATPTYGAAAAEEMETIADSETSKEEEDGAKSPLVESSAETTHEKKTNAELPTESAAAPGDVNDNDDTVMEDTDSAVKKTEAVEESAKPSETADDSDTATTKTNGDTTTTAAKPLETAAAPVAPVAASPPPPVMKGTLSYDADSNRHLIRGMWNYEHSTLFPPQRFELLRNLNPGEELKELPQNGEFHGSFSLAYFHTTSKGKQKERSKVIPESGVNIKFTNIVGEPGEYKVDGKGTNQFGIFHINGTASASTHDGDPTFNVVFRKRYEPTTAVAPAAAESAPVAAVRKVKVESGKTSSAINGGDANHDGGPLPPPSQSFPTGVVCLRGKLVKEESNDLGITEVVQKINGMWAAGLDFALADPDNARGLCNRFEYEHKSSMPTGAFPVSGRYSGWFDLSNEDGSRTRINERDVVLKFRKNSAGYHNVEGKGSNVFGKYSISGSLTKDNVITIFRHFQPRKLKGSKAGAPAAAVAHAPVAARRPAVVPVEPELKIDDVKVPASSDTGTAVEPITPPANATYSAVSRGVLRVNEDGSHSCNGKWAVTREHFTNGQTSNFNFRLESHFAAEAAAALKKDDNEPRQFPLDSPMYKGSFQLKKQGSRYQTIVDRQVVMKFRLNTQGSYNVYGKGMNVIGEFNLMGTMVMSGKTGGQVELYRMYPPERLTVPPVSKPAAAIAKPAEVQRSVSTASISQPSAAQRRESTRLVKLPSRLEDDDPSAQLSRTMEKCSQILRFTREKDVELGAFFSDPVDPIALGIPTYYQIIKEPMDLRTVHRRMEAEEINSPEEFSRIVRLIFENAMSFNIDPAHSVHQAARSLLIQFNQKFRDVDRMVQNIRRSHGQEFDEKGKKGGKEDRKRKKEEPPKSLKRRRLEEAQAMAASNSIAMTAIVAAASSTHSTTVSRTEFNMLLNHIQHLQQHMVKTYTALADLSPGDETDSIRPAPAQTSSSYAAPAQIAPTPAPAPEKKKPVKRKAEVFMEEESMPVEDDYSPLTLDEQELLTETINELPPEHLGGVIQIIREAAPVGADEDEIDLEIDQLSAVTQRKLLRHVSKFVKKSKAKPKKKAKPNPQPSKKGPKASAAKAKAAPKAKPAPAADSFFAFNKDDSDDSDDSEIEAKPSGGPSGGKVFNAAPTADFKLGEGLGELHDEHDEDLGNGGMAATWNLSKPVAQSAEDGDEDDAWGAAREEAAAAKAREADRKAREEKIKAEAEIAKTQRLADAVALGEEMKAQRLEDEANEVLEREQQEKEAEKVRKAARDAARAQVQSVEQTVDLDAQRDIMKQYEQSFLDKDIGSASPSSDFGF